MQPVVNSGVSFHRTPVITPLTVQLRVSIALHKLNCVQSMSRYFMCLSYHIPIYIQSSCSYSKPTWRSECWSSSLLMSMQQQFQVMCFYILHFYHRCYQGDTINGTRLGLYSKIQYCSIIFDKENLKVPVHIMQTSKQSNLNALTNHTL